MCTSENLPVLRSSSMKVFIKLEFDALSDDCVLLGDIIRDDAKDFWVVLSPSCDLFFDKSGKIKSKIENVLLLKIHTRWDTVPFLIKKISKKLKKKEFENRIMRRTCTLMKTSKWIFPEEQILLNYKDYKTVKYSEIREKLSTNK